MSYIYTAAVVFVFFDDLYLMAIASLVAQHRHDIIDAMLRAI